MTEFKLVWRVCPEPQGPYRSFHKRGWPMAYFNIADGKPAAYIRAADGQEYKPHHAKVEDVGFDLRVLVAIPNSHGSWDWRALKGSSRSIKEAKARALSFYESHAGIVDMLLGGR